MAGEYWLLGGGKQRLFPCLKYTRFRSRVDSGYGRAEKKQVMEIGSEAFETGCSPEADDAGGRH